MDVVAITLYTGHLAAAIVDQCCIKPAGYSPASIVLPQWLGMDGVGGSPSGADNIFSKIFNTMPHLYLCEGKKHVWQLMLELCSADARVVGENDESGECSSEECGAVVIDELMEWDGSYQGVSTGPKSKSGNL